MSQQLNALIAQGGTGVKSPLERYNMGVKTTQDAQTNKLAMQNARQKNDRDNEAANLKELGAMAKASEESDNPEATWVSLGEEYSARTGADITKQPAYSKELMSAFMAKAGMKPEEVKSPDVKVLKYGDQDLLMRNGQETGRTKTAIKSPLVNNSINASNKGDNKYAEKRLGGQAETMIEVEKSAGEAYKKMIALDNFLISSKDSTEGGAQPIISGVKNFLSSFGAEFEGLTDIGQMQQAVAQIKSSYMQELGARGLTDNDMIILGQSMPRVDASREARENVVRILKKSYSKKIDEYENLAKQEKESYIDLKVFTPGWYSDYTKYANEGDDLTPDEVAELAARESIANKQPPSQSTAPVPLPTPPEDAGNYYNKIERNY